MAVATIKQIYILPMTGATPQWMPFDVPDERYPGLTAGVRFLNDAGEYDGWQSTLQPVPFTLTCLVVVFTSVANAAILAAYATTDWEYVEDLPALEVP